MSENNIIRTKVKETSKIVWNNTWKCKKYIKTYGFDSALGWLKNPISVKTELVDLSQLGYFKKLTQDAYLMRQALDPNSLQTVKKWFKLKRYAEVTNKSSSLFLTLSFGRLFQTNLDITSPVPYNSIPEGLTIKYSEAKALNQQETNELIELLESDNLMVKPLCLEQLQNGEYREIV
jgi:hypothetical protein